LSHRLRVGMDLSRTDEINLVRRVIPEDLVFFGPGTGAGSKSFSQRGLLSTTVDYSASAVGNIGSHLKLSGTAGAQYYPQNLTLLSAPGRTFPSTDVPSIAGAATRLGSDDHVENITVGVFGQLQLGWKNRLFLTGALRGDDNSAFGNAFDFVTYPKVSA